MRILANYRSAIASLTIAGSVLVPGAGMVAIADAPTPQARPCPMRVNSLGFVSPCGECHTQRYQIPGVWDWTATGKKYCHGCD